MYKVTLHKDNTAEDITKLVEDLSWNESLDTVGVSLSFSVPDAQDRYISHSNIVAGDISIVGNDDGELIRAVVVSVSRDYPKRNIRAYDFGFYLNKNDIVIQFKNKSVSDCLKALFSKVGVSVGGICDMPAKVDSVYIKDIMEMA